MEIKNERILCIFFRLLKGEEFSVAKAACEFSVSKKSIQRDLTVIKNFLAQHRDLCQNAELSYSQKSHAYTLQSDMILSNSETIAILRLIYGTRAFSRESVRTITNKLLNSTTKEDRNMLDTFVKGELYNYDEMHHDCDDLIENIFTLTHAIAEKEEVTVWYYKMDRSYTERRIRPYSVIFNDFYFYVIASDESATLKFFRADRIKNIILHTKKELPPCPAYKGMNEYSIRKLCRFMFPGKMRKICFEFSGPSIQSILDRLPTAKIISKNNNIYTVEAQVYGDGIKMFLLSQGAWVRVISPQSLVDEMRKEANRLADLYR